MTGDALYRAIVANPGDDTPRLVYADWLEENDRAEEAAFLRADCRLESTAPEDPEYSDLLDQREELRLWLTAHAPGPKPRFPAGLMVRGGADWWRKTCRGFPRFLEFDGYGRSGTRPMRVLAGSLEKAFAKVPARWLVVRHITVEQLAELLRHPILASLDRLSILLGAVYDPQDEACELLARCSHLRNLRELVLIFPVGDVGAAALAHSQHFGRLERLRLDQAVWCTPDAMRSLGAADWFRGLHELDLYGLTDAAFAELCRLNPFPDLHTLQLGDSAFSIESWRLFATMNAFPRLTRLVNATEMAAGQAAALANTTSPRIADLDLHGCAMGNDGAVALARAPWIGSLRRLSLGHNRIAATGFAAIAGCGKFTDLKYLDLSWSAPGVRGLQALANNPALRGLTTLRLQGPGFKTRLTPEHFRAFLTRLDMPGLRHLSISDFPVGPQAARLLTDDKFRPLRRLTLATCKLTDAAVAALIAAPALQNLVELNIPNNGLRDGVKALTDPRTLPRLSEGNLASNPIDVALARRLRRRPGVFA